jgi:hypothetical protein
MGEVRSLFLQSRVRNKAYRRGWRVGVRNAVGFYPRQDFCPRHAMLHSGGRMRGDPATMDVPDTAIGPRPGVVRDNTVTDASTPPMDASSRDVGVEVPIQD